MAQRHTETASLSPFSVTDQEPGALKRELAQDIQLPHLKSKWKPQVPLLPYTSVMLRLWKEAYALLIPPSAH